MMSVKSKKFFVAVLSLSILITSIISVLTAFEFVHAETETLQEKIVRYTEDDFLEGEPNVTINEFAEKYKKGEYRPAGYPNGYPVTDIINKVVPKELFYTAGAHAYMGQEYGFIVYTYTNNTGISYYSQMLLIDFDFIIPEDSTSERNPVVTQPIYRMETILEAFLETSNDQGQSDWEIYQPQSWLGTDIYLQNVVISANLENENEYNAYDLNYDKQNDGGSIIEYATVDYCAHENVGKTNFGPITEWGVDILLTKGLDFLEDLEIPYISTGAKIVNKAISFAKDAKGFADAAGEIYTVSDETYTTIGSETQIKNRYITKEAQKNNAAYDSYSRELYIAQAQMGNAAKAQFVPDMNIDDKGKFQNSFVELGLVISGDPSNSRVTFSVGFEAIFQQVGSANFVLKDDGTLEIVSSDMPNSIPVIFTHTVEHKIRNAEVEQIKNNANTATDVDDNIADDPAYLLDKNGYILYRFNPLFNGNNAFGTYEFKTKTYLETQPSTRIYLLKSVHNGKEIDLDEIVNLSRDELLDCPYLLSYNNTNYSDSWTLKYSFTDQGSEKNNTYYLLYKYSFDYLGGSSAFLARYEFLPTELTLDNLSAEVNISPNGLAYYCFEPAETKNYSFSIQGLTDVEIDIFREDETIIENSGLNTLSTLLKAENKYIIVVKNLGNSNSAQIKVSVGSIVQNIDYIYHIEYSLSADQKIYYQFTPLNLSGTYEIVGDNIGNIQVDWYDANLGLIENNSATAFLTKGNIYYLSLRNKNASTAIAGTVEIEYQNDVVTFYPELEIITDTYKQYFAYVVNSANATDIPKTITVSVMSAGKIIEELCQDAVFNGDTFILDLSSYFIPEESYSFNCEICVNNSEIIALDPIEISNPVKENEETVTTSHSAEYVYLKYTKTQDFINKQINIPGNVKVLNIQASYSYYIRGLCFNIQAADSPLIININAIDIFAPSLLPTIKSNRDIILNCFGTVRLTGGFGINDGVLGDEDGLPAIQMHDNLLIINGSGSLTLEGGDGGNTSDGQEFYYNSTAGSGGTAIEVGDLVLNVSRLTIRGGDGGDGGDGIDGADGIDGVGYQENGVGARGTDGEYGGYACGGGNAGMGVWILGDMCVIYTTNLTISGGGAGNGGKGGDGGDGGDGAKGKDGGIFGGQCGGGNAGNGGNGCYGGDFGTGMIAFNEYDIHKIINLSGINYDAMLKEWSPDGIGGAGGKGGKGGTGGEGGKNFWGTRAPSGADGIDGIDGSPGGDPRPYPYRVSTNLLNNSSTIEQDRSNLIIEYMIRRIGIEKVAMLYDI